MAPHRLPSPPPLHGEFVMLGAGGHARVLHALLVACGATLAGVYDPQLVVAGVEIWQGAPVLGDDAALMARGAGSLQLINGIGQLTVAGARAAVYDQFAALGFRFPPLVHPAAWVAPNTELGDGVQVMAGAIIQPGCTIGVNSIVNTRASVDHDCQIGRHVHLAPGAVMCGAVRVGDGAFIGAGAVVAQSISVGRGALAGAGSVIVRHLPDGARATGAKQRITL